MYIFDISDRYRSSSVPLFLPFSLSCWKYTLYLLHLQTLSMLHPKHLHSWLVSSCSRAGYPSLWRWMLAYWLVKVYRVDYHLASQPFFSSFALCPSPATAPFFLAFPFFLPLRSLFFSPLIPAFQTSAYFTKNPSNSSACTTVLILSLSFFLSFDLPFVARIRTGRECGGCRSGKGDEGGKGMSVASGGSSGGDT